MFLAGVVSKTVFLFDTEEVAFVLLDDRITSSKTETTDHINFGGCIVPRVDLFKVNVASVDIMFKSDIIKL